MIFGALLSVAIVLAPAHSDGGHGAGESPEMGPVALLWPTDRAWHPDHDNHPPCGTSEGPTDRTEFPLSKTITARDNLLT